eukprot:10943006-Ditylum_brightwellii.AAC.1
MSGLQLDAIGFGDEPLRLPVPVNNYATAREVHWLEVSVLVGRELSNVHHHDGRVLSATISNENTEASLAVGLTLGLFGVDIAMDWIAERKKEMISYRELLAVQ